MKYRADIDGLRAIAVLSVVFYHLGFTSFFSSGFTGVDIFFVISGYLITTIIYIEILEKKFSYIDFYERRIRRIFPIFLFVLFTLLIFAYIISFYDMRGFLNSLFSSLVMGSNFYFWKDGDYFALPSHMKPLMHTWSLSIEEQFYLIFPPLLIFFASNKYLFLNNSKSFILLYISKNRVLFQLILLWMISFTICVLQSKSTTETAFFLLPYRLWELVTGSILAVYLINYKKEISLSLSNIIALLSMLLIIFTISFLDKLNAPFPSYSALFPCLGAALCIYACKNESTFLSKILSLSIIRFIGKISFSLYLWHWVVIVVARELVFLETHELTFSLQIICLIVSFTLSAFTYFVIELPIRKKIFLKDRKKMFIVMFFISIIIAILALYMKNNPKELNPDTLYYNSINYWSSKIKLPNNNIDFYKFNDINGGFSFFGNEDIKPTLFVIGDSYSEQLFQVLDKMANENNVCGILYSDHHTGLFNFFDSSSERNIKRTLYNTPIIKEILDNYNIKSVFIAVRWTHRINRAYINPNTMEILDLKPNALLTAIDETISYFNKETKIYIKYPSPNYPWHVPQRAAKASKHYDKTSEEFRKLMSFEYKVHLEKSLEARTLIEQVTETYNAEIIDFTSKICDENFCYGTLPNGDLVTPDSGHFMPEFSLQLEEELLPFILSGK